MVAYQIRHKLCKLLLFLLDRVFIGVEMSWQDIVGSYSCPTSPWVFPCYQLSDSSTIN